MKIHKGVYTDHGVYDFCSNQMTTSKVSHKWKKVTCKHCLKKRKKNGSQRGQVKGGK